MGQLDLGFDLSGELWVEIKADGGEWFGDDISDANDIIAGKSYYYNATTRATQWTLPECPDVKILTQEEVEQLQKKMAEEGTRRESILRRITLQNRLLSQMVMAWVHIHHLEECLLLVDHQVDVEDHHLGACLPGECLAQEALVCSHGLWVVLLLIFSQVNVIPCYILNILIFILR